MIPVDLFLMLLLLVAFLAGIACGAAGLIYPHWLNHTRRKP